jgi:tRNA Pseudouridine synthase II, C terminal.
MRHALAHLPKVPLDSEEAVAVSYGRVLGPAGVEGPYAVVAPDGRLLGVYRDDGAKARPEVVLSPAS